MERVGLAPVKRICGKDTPRSKKGFTLIEVTIVLTVTAIIVAMACAFIIVGKQQSIIISESSSAMADITLLKETINDWIDKNDERTADFIVSEHRIEIGSSSMVFEPDGSGGVGSLKVDDSIIGFATLADIKFSKKNSVENVIYCEATAKIGTKERVAQLVFDVQYGTSRERT